MWALLVRSLNILIIQSSVRNPGEYFNRAFNKLSGPAFSEAAPESWISFPLRTDLLPEE